MKLFWSPRTRAFRIAWMMEELGQPYELCMIDIDDEHARADPEFRSASPMGKVPALIDGQVRLCDSGAICIYLADAYPQANLTVSLDDPTRGDFLQWSLFTNAVIEPAIGAKFSGQPTNTRQSGFGSFDLMLKVLSERLQDGSWILGTRFTAPDVLIGSSIDFMDKLNVLPDDRSMQDYVERCRNRPAFERAVSLEDRNSP